MTAALSYHLVAYRRVWRSSVFSSFVIPLLWLAAIGLGVGGYIDRGTGGGLGVEYLAYLAPGLLASVTMNTAAAESSWPSYGARKWSKQYLAMLASPLRVVDVLLGHVAYVAIRLTLTAAAFFVAMALFGVLRSPWSPLGVAAAVLTGLAVSTPVFAFAAWIDSESRFPVLHRFGVVPVVLFSGVFFPVTQLPAALLPLAWASPLWHGVELSRAAVLGGVGQLAESAFLAGLLALLHVGYLAAWTVGGFLLAHRILTRRLVV